MLEKQTISINMGLGLDQTKNDQSGDPKEYSELIDFVWNKEKQLEKRPGTTLLPQTTSVVGPTFPTIGATNVFNGISSLGDQLLLQNKGAFYSYNDLADNWVQKGWSVPCEITTSVVASGSRTNYAPNSKRFANTTVHVYQVDSSNELRYTVVENSTGNVLLEDQLIEVGYCPRFFTTSVGSYIAYCGGASYGIRVRDINVNTGSISSATTVYATNTNNFDVQVLPNSARGERIVFIAARQATGAGDTVDMIARDASFAPDGSLPTVNFTAPRQGTAVLLYFNPSISENRLFIAYQYTPVAAVTVRNQGVAVYEIGPSGWVVARALTSVRQFQQNNQAFFQTWDRETNVINITAYRDPFTNFVNILFQDDAQKYAQSTGQIVYPTIYRCQVSLTGATVNNSEPIYFGYTLLSKAVDAADGGKYLVLGTALPTQNSEIIVDFNRNRQTAPTLQPIAKINFQKTLGNRWYPSLCDLEFENGSLYYSSANKIRDASRSTTGLLTPAVNLSLTSVTYNKIELQKQRAQNKAKASDSLFVSGGYLAEFDGAEITENNFHVAPDFLDVNYQYVANRFIGIGAFGTLGSLVVGLNGARFENSPQFFAFTFVPTGVSYRCYVYDETSGFIPPTGAWTNINVPISITMNQEEIAARIQNQIWPIVGLSVAAWNVNQDGAVRGSYAPTLFSDFSGITNIQPSTGNVPAAPIRYAAIYTYTDYNGKTHRSAPVFTPSFTPTSVSSVGLVLYMNQASAKLASSVRVEFYRTEGNGSTFYKISPPIFDKTWGGSSLGRVSFVDQVNDTTLAFAEQLYTNGNVQENIGLSAVSALTVYKSRLYAVTRDNPTSVYYSKTIVDGVPVEFTPFNFLPINSTNSPITALGVLDDTLVIFKEEEIYFVSGDGANEIGTNVSFSQPTSIATDVGCIDPNTIEIIPQGLTFMSKMGFHMINRGRSVEYVGYQVEDYNTNNICKALALKDNNQSRELRLLMSDSTRALTYDYLMNKWGTFSQYTGQDATLWKNQFVRVNGSGQVWLETLTNWTDVGATVPSYNPILETEWLNIKDAQDYQRIYRLMILGQLFTACDLKYQIYYDYDLTNFDSYTFSSSNITGAQPGDTVYQPQIHLKRQKCQAIKIRLEIDATGSNNERTLKMTDMSFQVGLKRGLNKVKASKRL